MKKALLLIGLMLSSTAYAARPDYVCQDVNTVFSTNQMKLIDTDKVRVYTNDVYTVVINKADGSATINAVTLTKCILK